MPNDCTCECICESKSKSNNKKSVLSIQINYENNEVVVNDANNNVISVNDVDNKTFENVKSELENQIKKVEEVINSLTGENTKLNTEEQLDLSKQQSTGQSTEQQSSEKPSCEQHFCKQHSSERQLNGQQLNKQQSSGQPLSEEENSIRKRSSLNGHSNEQNSIEKLNSNEKPNSVDCHLVDQLSTKQFVDQNYSLQKQLFNNLQILKSRQQTQFSSQSLCAVQVSRLHFSQGTTKILNGIDLFVPKGSIYCLIGPSGCGKTTLLRCVIGCTTKWSGQVKVFGKTPGCSDGEIPGPLVGYMPQDGALYEDMTVYEQLVHFGRMSLCKLEDIRTRARFLLEFLDMLSLKHRMTSTLSGGQLRRLSFAVALIHSPALLILDEPTAGVDPLLRYSMWCYLRSLTQKENITVIITTHYVEEARQADIVGLMRKGIVLTEESPEMLLERIQVDTIEEAFLKLVKQITQGKNSKKKLTRLRKRIKLDDNDKGHVNLAFDGTVDILDDETQYDVFNKGDVQMVKTDDNNNFKAGPSKCSKCLKSNCSCSRQPPSLRRQISSDDQETTFYQPEQRPKDNLKDYWQVIHVLNIKNWNRTRRHPELILFQFFMPIVIVFLFCFCIGPMPHHIKIGIVNEECIQMNKYVPDDNCTGKFGRAFLNQIDSYLIEQHKYGDLDEARSQVKTRDLWGVIHIKENFTESIEARINYANEEADEDAELYAIDRSTIKVYADLTDKVIQITVQKALFEAFRRFTFVQLNEEGFNPKLAQPPIVLGKPIYGRDTRHEGYTEFMMPGILINISFVMACGLTGLIFLLERRNGMFERMMVCGVTKSQVIIAHTIYRIGTMSVSNVVTLSLVLLFLDLHSKGSIFWIFVILILQNCSGMTFGMVVSSVTKSENGAAIGCASIVVVNLTLCGIIWPLEAIPYWIRWASILMPSTMPTEALRGLMNKGWGIESLHVQLGLYASLIWSIVFAVLASKIFKFVK